MNKHKLNLELILPDEAMGCDACVRRLVDALSATPGVSQAHVEGDDAERLRLCLHYEPSLVRVDEVAALVRGAGAHLTARYGHLSVPVLGLRHERQARLVESMLARQPGVLHASVAFGTRRLLVEFDLERTSREAVLAAAEEVDVVSFAGPSSPAAPLGGHAHAHKPAHGHVHDHNHGHAHGTHGHGHAHGGPFGERSALVFSLACGAFTGIGWGAESLDATGWVPMALFALAYVFGSWFTLKEVVVALRARRFEIDFLMLFAAVGAAVLGEWFEGSLLLFLFTLGHALEGYAMGRARSAIEALAKLVPETALRISDERRQEEVPVGALAVGDRIFVKPNKRIPADGFVIEGVSSVNQAPITGESVPVEKRPVPDRGTALRSPETLAAEHRVFAGAINGTSALSVVVTKRAGESTLARVVKLVAEAETQKSPTQQFTDRFERLFVPVILVAVVALLFAWVIVDEPFTRSFYRAMAVLVAASPCALAIATPSAVLAGVARAARSGVLVKGGAHLEALGLVRTVAFDKTGTLTKGKPELTDVVVFEGSSEKELLSVAASVEKQSDHPLARAIVDGASKRRPDLELTGARNVEALIGMGVRASMGEDEVSIGKAALFTGGSALPSNAARAVEELQAGGRSVMVVRVGERFLGALGVMDAPRESARAVIAELHELGVEQTLMLTGDNQRVADEIAKQVGIRVARGDLLPEQKLEAVLEIARSGRGIAMVGDGVNDAPAMANATVGIAMGAGGSDVALEAADVALMADDLRALPFAVGLSRAARSIIRQNLWASLGMVAFLVPATVFDFARIGVAVALHEGSTLLVVVNALRLLAYERRVVA